MRFIAIILFLLPILTFPLIFSKTNIIGPANIWSLLYFIKISIPGILYSNRDALFSIQNATIREAMSNDDLFVVYALLQMICYYLVIFGMGIIRSKKGTLLYINPRYYTYEFSSEYEEEASIGYRIWGVIFILIGLLAYFSMMRNVGGIAYFYTHLQYRASLIRDYDIQSWLMNCLHYGPLLLVYSLKGTHKPLSLKIILLLMLCGFLNGLGGRKDLLMMLIQGLFIYHFSVAPLKIRDFLKSRYVITALIAFLFFTVYVQLRTETSLQSFISNPIGFITNDTEMLTDSIRSESYIPYYVTILNHFKYHQYWLGASFKGLITAIIPSSLFANKPPVDDGMYLYSICRGRDIIPVMPARELDGSSFPLETFGSMYANFGMIGLLLGMVFLGIIIGYAYRKMVKSNFTLFSIMIYTHILFNFQLSTLRIFQLFMTVVMTWIVVWSSQTIRLRISEKN